MAGDRAWEGVARAVRVFSVLLLSAAILGPPLQLILRYTGHLFFPGWWKDDLLKNPTNWLFLYAVFLAWGAALIRPRRSRVRIHALLLVPVLLQAAALALLWWLKHLRPEGTPGWGPAYEAVTYYSILVAPLVAVLHQWSSRRGGLLLVGQLVPAVFTAYAIGSGVAFMD